MQIKESDIKIYNPGIKCSNPDKGEYRRAELKINSHFALSIHPSRSELAFADRHLKGAIIHHLYGELMSLSNQAEYDLMTELGRDLPDSVKKLFKAIQDHNTLEEQTPQITLKE